MRLVFLIVLAMSSVFQIALPETVSVHSGTSVGQGWVFTEDGETCWVATAKHVVIDGAGIIVSGPDGVQGEATQIYRHPDRDLVIAEIFGALAKKCPFSPRGDRDSSATARALQREGRIISFERRSGRNDGKGDFGLEIIPIRIVGLSESARLFNARALEGEEVIQGDSGSPVRLTGTGVGEAGWPLGLVISTKEDLEIGILDILPMDVVRAFHESIKGRGKTEKQISGSGVAFEIDSFSGDIPDTACGPSNLLNPETSCGWRVHKLPQSGKANLTLKLDSAVDLVSINFDFIEAAGLSLVGVRTRLAGGAWGSARACYKSTDSLVIACSFGQWRSDEIMIEFEGSGFELGSIKIN